MAPETFILSPCTPGDIEGMIAVYERAFENDYLSSFTFPRERITDAEKKRWLRARFLSMFAKPEIRTFKFVESSTGRMAAWARWGFPYNFTEAELKEREAGEGKKYEWPVGSNLEVCDGKFGVLHEKREMYTKKDETYIVYLLCTDPDFQRKGLARKLLQHGLDLADAEGRQTYIEATKDGHPVYLKLGFKDIDVLTMDLSKWGGKELGVNRIMMRDPKPLS